MRYQIEYEAKGAVYAREFDGGRALCAEARRDWRTLKATQRTKDGAYVYWARFYRNEREIDRVGDA